MKISPLCQSVNSLTFLKLMYELIRSTKMDPNFDDEKNSEVPQHLLNQLEVLACESATLKFRPCEVALALLATHIQVRVDRDVNRFTSLRFLSKLQKYCKVSCIYVMFLITCNGHKIFVY